MAFGSLPGMVTLEDQGDRKDFLRSCANLYLEEEIRAEALSRKIGAFSRFLELAARLPLEPSVVEAQKGILFEHAVILETVRRIRALKKDYRVCFWRTSAGAEVDCVVDMEMKAIPIEVKASKKVRLGELKGLVNFLADYKSVAKEGYVITMGEAPERLAENILAVPWQNL